MGISLKIGFFAFTMVKKHLEAIKTFANVAKKMQEPLNLQLSESKNYWKLPLS